MRIELYGDGLGYVTDEVSTIPVDEANTCEENRIKFVTDLAAISRGNKESKNPAVRYKALLKEAAPNDLPIDGEKASKVASRPLEFLPVVITYDQFNDIFSKIKYHDEEEEFDNFINKIARYSYFKRGMIYTNMRALYNAGIPYEKIPYNTKEELAEFKVLRVKLPMFTWAQVMTHTAISKESQSDRISSTDEYWVPSDIVDRLYALYNKSIIAPTSVDPEIKKFLDCSTENYNSLLFSGKPDEMDLSVDEIIYRSIMKPLIYGNYGQQQVQDIFKELGYKQEIYSRAPYYFKYKEFIMTGWKNDPAVWDHFLLEREAYPELYESWAQEQIKEFAAAARKILNKE